nr:hypothetical protein [Tanacetum cinerariifolium]
QMVNTRTDAELSAAVQNALQTLLPQIRAKIREEFRTGSGPLDFGGNPPPVTVHTWIECFNKQKPCSFEKATAPVDAENWISYMGRSLMSWVVRMHSRLDWLCTSLRVMHLLGGKPIRAAAGTAEEHAKNFQWGLRRQKSGDRHQPTTQQSSHRNHSHNNDRHGSDRRGSGDNHRSNNNYSGNNNRNSGNGRDQRNRGQQSNRSVNSGNSSHPGGCHRAAGTCFKCGQTVHLQKDCKKNTAASTSSQADKKPRAS